LQADGDARAVQSDFVRDGVRHIPTN
jgi:hypothetical protein